MERSKKVAGWMKFENNELKDLPVFIHQYHEKINSQYGDVLSLAVEQYLGRKFNPETDSDRIYLNIIENSNQTDVFIDNNLIGSISTRLDYNNDDFIQDKRTF